MKYVNKEVLKVVGNAGLRVGKEIIREGTKVVVFKAGAAVIGGALTKGMKGVKEITLDDVLGDLTRAEKKAEKRLERIRKRQENKLRKQGYSEEDIEELRSKVEEAVGEFVEDEKEVTE